MGLCGSCGRQVKPIAAVARDLGVNAGTLGNWVAVDQDKQEGRGELSPRTSLSSSGCGRKTPSCGWSVMSQAISGPVGEGGDEVSVARFIADQRTSHRVPHAVSCRLLGVSESWFYKVDRARR